MRARLRRSEASAKRIEEVKNFGSEALVASMGRLMVFLNHFSFGANQINVLVLTFPSTGTRKDAILETCHRVLDVPVIWQR